MNLLYKMWNVLQWPVVAVCIGFVVLVAWRVQVLTDKENTAEDVAAIHANKLTWEDIGGDLPPAPDPVANEATLVGIDTNKNGIRDDVERTIYQKYKNQPKVAIAMLQYAKALQMEFTHVYNSETLVAVIQQQDRGSVCLKDIRRKEEVSALVFNNAARTIYSEDLYNKYLTTYALLDSEGCDIQF